MTMLVAAGEVACMACIWAQIQAPAPAPAPPIRSYAIPKTTPQWTSMESLALEKGWGWYQREKEKGPEKKTLSGLLACLLADDPRGSCSEVITTARRLLRWYVQ
jgi:hypothetical protein